MAADLSKRSTCWTCRLRHKKCDQNVPVCGNCTALGIDCHTGAEKPQWMDKGEGQQAMTTRLKAQVKQVARRRRGAAMMRRVARDLSVPPAGTRASDNLPSDDPHFSDSPCLSSTSTELQESEPGSRSAGREQSLREGSEPHFERASNPAIAPNELDLGFVVAFLDYVFPILFPHYRPLIVNGGRSWLLSLSMTSKSFLKGLLSLSSMFLSTIPSEVNPGHEACASKTWEELRKQADMALAAMQHDLKDIMGWGVQNRLTEGVHLLASIMQLLALELTMTPPEKWHLHLDAATGLFEQIMYHHGVDNSALALHVVLAKIGRPSRAAPNLDCANQAAFRFFSSTLIFSDVIASTSLGRAPRLRYYHSNLGHNEYSDRPAFSLEEVTGCQDWVVKLLGDIIILKEWKEDQSRIGELLMSELVHRGILLDERLENGLETVGSNATAKRNSEPSRPLQMLFKHSGSDGSEEAVPEMYLNLTRIWAFAARIYLFATVMDGRLEEHNIRRSVERAMCLLLEVRSPV